MIDHLGDHSFVMRRVIRLEQPQQVSKQGDIGILSDLCFGFLLNNLDRPAIVSCGRAYIRHNRESCRMTCVAAAWTTLQFVRPISALNVLFPYVLVVQFVGLQEMWKHNRMRYYSPDGLCLFLCPYLHNRPTSMKTCYWVTHNRPVSK